MKSKFFAPTLLIGQPTMVAQLALSARKFEREGEPYRLVCGPALSDPRNAWKVILQEGSYHKRVIIIGVPYRTEAEVTVQKLRKEGIEVIWVIHASTRGRPLGYLLESGLKIHICGNRASTYYGRAHKDDMDILKLNKLKMWDPDHNTENEDDLRRCWAFRNCAIADTQHALDIIHAGNLDEFDPYFVRPQVGTV